VELPGLFHIRKAVIVESKFGGYLILKYSCSETLRGTFYIGFSV